MTQTRIFSKTISEGQDNLDIVTSTMFVFGTPARVLFDFGSSRSFVSTAYALYAN